MRSSKNKSSRNRKNNKPFAYDTLEDKNLLASLVTFNAGTGALDVTMSAAGDQAVVDIAGGNIEVNSSQDLDPATAGTQSVPFTALRSINIVGSSLVNQDVVFRGDYSNNNTANVQSITVTGVSSVNFDSDYDLAGNLVATLAGSGGAIHGTAGTTLTVGGTTNIAANDNGIALNSLTNDFVGQVTASTTGAGRDILLSDANNLVLNEVTTVDILILRAGGDITNTAGTTVSARDAFLTAANVTLGNQTGDTVNFSRVSSTTTGDTFLSEDSSTTLLDVTAQNLDVRSAGGLFDGRQTSISVVDNASFDAVGRIRIGENGTDTYDAGTTTFKSAGHVHIWEDSGILLTGTNTASSLNLFSAGDIEDDATATVNVTNITGLEGSNVNLGDTGTDAFNSGALYFYTPGAFFLRQDSAMHIIESKNFADRMQLFSTDSITDADDARITVTNLSIFNANSVNIGDSANDLYNSGSIQFNTAALFRIAENSSTNIVGTNTANNAMVTSAGNITNVFAAGTKIDVATVAEFTTGTGNNITLGNQAADDMKFGALRVEAPANTDGSGGVVTVTETDATNFTFDSVAGQLNMTSAGGVTDAPTAKLNVRGVANIQGTSINIGDTTTDEFNANSVTLNSTGTVTVSEDTSLNLHKTSTAAAMFLTANGLITDGLDANTTVSGLMSVTGSLINLGSEMTDNLVFDSLTFNSTSNTNISADSRILLTGVSQSLDRLFLTSTGDIEDAATAQTRVQNQANFTAIDIEIGDLAGDCFDILNGDINDVFRTASGTTNSVTLGGC